MSRIEIEHFDRAIIEHMEPVLVLLGEGDQAREEYALVVEGVRGVAEYRGHVPVYFSGGEQSFGAKFYPHVAVTLTSDEPDEQRFVGLAVQDIRPAPQTSFTEVEFADGTTRSGADFLEVQPLSHPRKFSYRIDIVARGSAARREAKILWVYLLQRFLLDGFSLKVYDAEDEERTYDGSVDEVPIELQYPDLSVREVKRSISVSIRGEYDISPTLVHRAVTTPPSSGIGRL